MFANAPCDAACAALVESASAVLNAGLAPRLEEDGTGGTYFIQNGPSKKSTVAVFKPADEEQLTPNNPKDLVGRMGQEGMRKGIPSGAGCLREGALC